MTHITFLLTITQKWQQSAAIIVYNMKHSKGSLPAKCTVHQKSQPDLFLLMSGEAEKHTDECAEYTCT